MHSLVSPIIFGHPSEPSNNPISKLASLRHDLAVILVVVGTENGIGLFGDDGSELSD